MQCGWMVEDVMENILLCSVLISSDVSLESLRKVKLMMVYQRPAGPATSPGDHTGHTWGHI